MRGISVSGVWESFHVGRSSADITVERTLLPDLEPDQLYAFISGLESAILYFSHPVFFGLVLHHCYFLITLDRRASNT